MDDGDVECPVKENIIDSIHHWAINHLAGERKDDPYTRVRELMVAEL